MVKRRGKAPSVHVTYVSAMRPKIRQSKSKIYEESYYGFKNPTMS